MCALSISGQRYCRRGVQPKPARVQREISSNTCPILQASEWLCCIKIACVRMQAIIRVRRLLQVPSQNLLLHYTAVPATSAAAAGLCCRRCCSACGTAAACCSNQPNHAASCRNHCTHAREKREGRPRSEWAASMASVTCTTAPATAPPHLRIRLWPRRHVRLQLLQRRPPRFAHLCLIQHYLALKIV